MLSLIDNISVLSSKLNISIDAFPPFYQKKLSASSNVIIFVKDRTVVPLSFSNHYFLKTAQFLFYPLKDNQRLQEAEEKVFVNSVLDHLVKARMADRVIPPPNYVIFSSYPDKSEFCEFGTYYLDLSLSRDQLWENIHSKHKNVIRNAKKKGCEIKIGIDQTEVFYELYKRTMERSSLSYYSLNYFKKVIFQTENVLCAVAYYANKPQGALFMPYSTYGAYYLYGASADEVEVTGLNNYLHWEMIKWCQDHNILRYDFVGARLSDVSNSRLSGIQMFKERFGAVLQKGYLWKMDMNFKCRVYDFFVDFKGLLLFKKNRFMDIIDSERKK